MSSSRGPASSTRALVPAVLAALLAGCAGLSSAPAGVEGWRSFTVRVKNGTEHAFTHAPVVLSLERIRAAHPGFNPDGYRVFTGADVEIDSQCDDVDLDGTADEIALQLHLAPKQEKTLKVYSHPAAFLRPVHRRRAHAAVRPEFEGPGWESDVIAYRTYMDERSPVDIFGKSEPGLSLDRYVSGDPIDYHTVRPWGVDVLKVGDALGCGGFALWHEGKLLRAINPPAEGPPYQSIVRRFAHVVADGPVRAILRYTHDQWQVGDEKVTAVVDYTIWGGKRWSECRFRLKGAAGHKTAATGIVRKPGIEAIQRDGYLCTFGPQTVDMDDTHKPDLLGMAVLFRPEDFITWENRALSHSTPEAEPLTHVVTLAMDDMPAVRWWILAAWSRGSLGITTADAFEAHVREVAREVAFEPEVLYP